MKKFDTWSITCNFCYNAWETCSSVMAYHPKCPHCESTDCNVEKNRHVTIKKKGKIIMDMPADPLEDISGDLNGDVIHKTTKTEKPLVVIKKDFLNFDTDLSTEEKKEIIKKMDEIKSQLIRDIIDDEI